MNDIFLMKFHLNKVLVLNYLADWYDSFLLKKNPKRGIKWNNQDLTLLWYTLMEFTFSGTWIFNKDDF